MLRAELLSGHLLLPRYFSIFLLLSLFFDLVYDQFET
jgi:hypothetical protein